MCPRPTPTPITATPSRSPATPPSPPSRTGAAALLELPNRRGDPLRMSEDERPADDGVRSGAHDRRHRRAIHTAVKLQLRRIAPARQPQAAEGLQGDGHEGL